MEVGKTYRFEQLEKMLLKDDRQNVFIIVRNIQYNETAVMHLFLENFAENWLSGEGVLFYSDGVAKSADGWDEFELLSINTF